MKVFCIGCRAFLFLCLLSFPVVAMAEDTASLVIEMSGFASDKGHVLLNLANSRENFESDGEGYRAARQTIENGVAKVEFTGLPYGEYAIKVFQDEDDNGKLDIGWMGPKEPYGFSNDARGTMGPPDWDEAKFAIDTPTQVARIRLE